MRRLMRPARQASRGQSIVELAISMPLLLLLMLGTIDIGRVFFDYIEMRNAVVEGATYGSRHPMESGEIANVTMRHGLPGDAVVTSAVSGECGQPQGGGSITVTATHTFTPIFLGGLNAVAPDVDWTFDVRASSTIRCMT
jgi:Flp pilus assembly protein TadG